MTTTRELNPVKDSIKIMMYQLFCYYLTGEDTIILRKIVFVVDPRLFPSSFYKDKKLRISNHEVYLAIFLSWLENNSLKNTPFLTILKSEMRKYSLSELKEIKMKAFSKKIETSFFGLERYPINLTN